MKLPAVDQTLESGLGAPYCSATCMVSMFQPDISLCWLRETEVAFCSENSQEVVHIVAGAEQCVSADVVVELLTSD